MRPLVLYHASCSDGFAAAFSAWLKLRDTADYFAVNHGQPVSDAALDNTRDLFVLDFSYPAEVLLRLCSSYRKIIVLDHHKEAQKKLAGAVHPGLEITFDLTKSGGRLAWEHFHPNVPAPWIIDYTEDRDLWKHALPDTHAVSAWMRSFPFGFDRWKSWMGIGANGYVWKIMVVEQGNAILRYQQTIIDGAVSHANEMDFDGHKILTTNTTTLVSEIGQALARNRPFSATWFERADGKRVWSLRSAPDGLDVGEIATRHGGGGHKHAAGFEV